MESKIKKRNGGKYEMKFNNVLLLVLWLFYTTETIAAFILGGDWGFISLVAVVFIPIIWLVE